MRQMHIPRGSTGFHGTGGMGQSHGSRPLQEGTTHMHKLIDEKQAAALLHVSVKSLQGWRYRGGGPGFVKLGRSVRYAMTDLEDFVLEARRTSTSDPGPRAAFRFPPGVRVVPAVNTGPSSTPVPSAKPAMRPKPR